MSRPSALLDQIVVEGGEVEIWIGILGVDVDLVAAVVEADRGEHGAVLVAAGEPGAIAAFLGPAAVGTGQPDAADTMRGAIHQRISSSGEAEMIQSVFDLGDAVAREVMVPRTEIVWIEQQKSVRQIGRASCRERV